MQKELGISQEDVVVLVDSAGVALRVQRAVSARVRGVCAGGCGLIASKCVEIPVVGSNGEVSAILCHTRARSDTRGAAAPHRRERVRAIPPTRRSASPRKNLRVVSFVPSPLPEIAAFRPLLLLAALSEQLQKSSAVSVPPKAAL